MVIKYSENMIQIEALKITNIQFIFTVKKVYESFKK